MKKDFLTFGELTPEELAALLDSSAKLKKDLKENTMEPVLKGMNMVMIFEKPSTRTRISFEVGIDQLGADPVVLQASEMQLGRGETIDDTARVLSRYTDAVIIRANSHAAVEQLAAAASVPVINALSDRFHPCQALADLFTIKEKKGPLEGLKMAYVGDGNNVCHSLMLAAGLSGMTMYAACPEGYRPDISVTVEAERLATQTGGRIIETEDVMEAVKGADVLYTDVWISMGDEAEAEQRLKDLRPYQMNVEVLDAADPDVIVMHCLPAHRGQEITADVLDSPASVVFDQAENRLHVQKALMVELLT